MQIEWKIVPNWTEYEISEYGNIRRIVKKYGFIGDRKPYLPKAGYLYIVMRENGKKKAQAIHRLVAEAFIGLPTKEKPFVAHNDGDRFNNHYSNLRYVTRSENEIDKLKHGKSNRGERQGGAKLKEQDVIEIKKALILGASCSFLGEKYNVSAGAIKSIKGGQSWSWLEI